MLFSAFLISALQLFAITDPIGNLPIFHSLTRKQSDSQRLKTYRTAVFFGFSLLVAFAFLGNGILEVFRISMGDFKIAGGILILIIAILILVRGSWLDYDEQPESVGAVPIGCPLLVGPGAITTAMVSMGIYGVRAPLLAIGVNFLIAYFTLIFGEKIFKILGPNGSEIISKVMAIILAAIAVSFIHSGVNAWVLELSR